MFLSISFYHQLCGICSAGFVLRTQTTKLRGVDWHTHTIAFVRHLPKWPYKINSMNHHARSNHYIYIPSPPPFHPHTTHTHKKNAAPSELFQRALHEYVYICIWYKDCAATSDIEILHSQNKRKKRAICRLGLNQSRCVVCMVIRAWWGESEKLGADEMGQVNAKRTSRLSWLLLLLLLARR